MPQAAIPDINVSIIRYREYLLKSRIDKDPAGVWFAIQGLNGLLDPDFKITFVPRQQYELQLRAQHITHCHCGVDISFDPVQVKARPAGWAMRAAGRKTRPTLQVKCVACGDWQHIDFATSDIAKVVKSPLDVKDLPYPPQHSSMSDLIYNEYDFWRWLDLVMYVMEDRLRKFREKYRVSAEEDVAVLDEGPDAEAPE